MKNLYWVFIAIVILLGAYASIKFGLEPKAVPVVKPSNFEDPQKIGEVIHRQLFQKMDEYSIVAIGQESIPLTESVVEGLVRENEFGKPFDQIVSVGEEFKNSKIPVVVTKRETSDLLETLKKFEGKRVLLIAQSGDTPHFQPGNLMDVLPKELNKKILSFSMVTFQYGMDPTGSMEEECRRQSQSSSQFRHLSCIAVSKSMGMRKNTKVRRQDPVVVVELHGEDDYVIFTHFPQSS